MKRVKRAKPSPALIVAVVALVAALAGTAVGGVVVNGLNKKQSKQVKKIARKQGKKQGKKQAKKQIGKRFPVQSSQIADAAVAGAKIADGAVAGTKIADGAIGGPKIIDGAVDGPKIADGAIGGSKVAVGSIDDSKLADLDLFGDSFVRATVTDRTTETFEEALASAPKVPLFSRGQLSVYGSCFEYDAFETRATISVESSAAGAILSGSATPDPNPSPPGGPPSSFKARIVVLDGDPDFLDPGTAGVDKMVGYASVGSGSFQTDDLTRVSFSAMSPDGTAINGLMSVAVGAGGVYGNQAACLFGGFGIG